MFENGINGNQPGKNGKRSNVHLSFLFGHIFTLVNYSCLASLKSFASFATDFMYFFSFAMSKVSQRV